MIAAGPTRRRWFQFGLGGFLFVVTLLAVWLGLATEHIRARRATREWITANHGMIVTGADAPNLFDPPPRAAQISLARRWLGDEAIAYVWMPKTATGSDWSNARPLFPEALWMDEISYDWVPNNQVRHKPPRNDDSSRFLTIAVSTKEREAYEKAAMRAGVSLRIWLLDQLTEAAARQR